MVNIERKEGYVVWTVNLSGVKKETYILPEDVEGVLLGGGTLLESLKSGAKFDFKAKKYKHDGALELVLSSTRPIELRWGVFDVPYRDYQAKLDAKCGLSGTLSLKLLRTQHAAKALGKNATTEDVSNLVFNELKMKIEEMLVEVLNDDAYGRPDIAGAKKTKLIEGIKTKVYDYLSSFALDLSSVTLNRLVTDDEYEERRHAYDEEQEKKKKVKNDLKLKEEIDDAFGHKDDDPAPSQKVVICPRCHRELNPEFSNCPYCGMRLR